MYGGHYGSVRSRLLHAAPLSGLLSAVLLLACSACLLPRLSWLPTFASEWLGTQGNMGRTQRSPLGLSAPACPWL